MTPSIEVFQDDSRQFLESNFIDHPIKNSETTIKVNKDVQANQPSTYLVGEALLNHIGTIDHDICEAGEEDSFFVADMGEVYRSFLTWKNNLPQVQPYYAVKCNTDRKVIELLGNLGVNFDCASKNEIDTVLNLGFDANRIIYANPCKTNSFIRHSQESKVNLTTVDNCQELLKLKKFHPNCDILIRIATDDETAQCRLSTKFGCSVNAALTDLLPMAKELNLNVKGVAFHVGSGAKDLTSIFKAIRDSKKIFDIAINQFEFDMSILDIGGGFEHESFNESSKMVTQSLNQFFPGDFIKQHQIKLIAEPGRFMVANAFTLATHVIARRDLSNEIKSTTNIEAMIYINDGVYGNLNCILFDHYNPIPYVLTHRNKSYFGFENDANGKGNHRFSIWGPTCDGLDCVSNGSNLMANVEVGDWLYFPKLGAYTSTAATSFNGFKAVAHTIYVSSEDLSDYGF